MRACSTHAPSSPHQHSRQTSSVSSSSWESPLHLFATDAGGCCASEPARCSKARWRTCGERQRRLNARMNAHVRSRRRRAASTCGCTAARTQEPRHVRKNPRACARACARAALRVLGKEAPPSRRCSQYARAERKQAYIEERTQRLGFRAQSLGAESGTLSCCVATAHLACSSEGLQLQGGCVGAINGDCVWAVGTPVTEVVNTCGKKPGWGTFRDSDW